MSRSKRVVWGWLFGVVAAAFLGGMSLAWGAAPDAVQAEYERRAARLEPDDVAGHLELAIWCKEQGAYEPLRKQCTLILAQEGEHKNAKLLLKLAMRHLGPSEESQDRSGKSGRGASGEAVGKLGRVISDAEIQRIRWMEMMREEPRPLSIEFKNKVIQRFLDAMEGAEQFTGREKRRAFMRLKPMEKVQQIRGQIRAGYPDDFSEDIVIRTDPKRMADFERRVLPVVLSGCATGRCHGDPQASRFALYTDRVMSKNKVYTNYLIMHDYRVGDKRLINRDIFKQSLLLTYGFHELPAALGKLNPSYKHPGDIKAIYRGVNDPKYRDIRDWLESLSSLEPDYGISPEPPGSSP